MKKIDDLFKSALKGHELPYNESAWNEMSKRLDARGGSAGYLKWICGVSVAAIAIGTIFYFNHTDTNTKNNTDLKLVGNNKKEFKSKFSPVNSEEIDSNYVLNNDTITRASETKLKIEKRAIFTGVTDEKEKSSVKKAPSPIVDKSLVEEVLVPPVYRESIIELEEDVKDNETQVQSIEEEDFVFSFVSNQCINEEWSYTNKNNQSIWLNSPSNDIIEINAYSEHKEILRTKGRYQIGILNQENEFISKTAFTVFEANEAQITSDDALNYENGLPELNLETYQEGKHTWSLDGEVRAKNQSAHVFKLFKKGIHTMSIKTTDANGCNASSSITFNVESDYNLLAVNAFSPSSTEPRNTHFIPFALTQRNTPFKMIIIDPADGAVLFETSAADMPWDGTDRNTGKMVDTNKSYVWKVVLEQPEANENPEYVGTVIRL